MSTQELVIREEEPLVVVDPAMLRHRVKVIQQVMRDVMQEGTHYGQIPGTPKPSLWQPGAEILCQTFGISIKCEPVEERITDEEVFYRVRATATNYQGREIGSREAVCSTREKKYRWRRPVHPKEFEATPEHMRRVTWDKDGKEVLQVRTDPGDQAETILAMATKRAHVALTRQVTGCSGMFAEGEIEEDDPKPEPVKSPAPGAPTPTAPAPTGEQIPLGDPGDGGPPIVKVTSAKAVKTGGTEEKPWTLYVVKTSDGGEYTTFDKKLCAAAAKAQIDDAPVRISAEPVEGKNPKLLEVVRA